MSNQWNEAKCRADARKFIEDDHAQKQKDRKDYVESRPYESYVFVGEFADSKQTRRKIYLNGIQKDDNLAKIKQYRHILEVTSDGALLYPAEWLVYDPVRHNVHKTESVRFVSFYEVRGSGEERACKLMATYDYSTNQVETNRQVSSVSNVLTLYFK